MMISDINSVNVFVGK